MCENIYVEKDERLIVGFINSHGELEYTEYEAKDGGVFELDESKEYTKEELEEFLLENV
jgi:hypothetical protein|tara:strand:- start:34845 stop:35021 length:177 start_codon:yes stop_codon:yes gene_type:complete